jgi:hypothetical protein
MKMGPASLAGPAFRLGPVAPNQLEQGAQNQDLLTSHEGLCHV